LTLVIGRLLYEYYVHNMAWRSFRIIESPLFYFHNGQSIYVI
jgi:hypothetical protein